MLKGISAALIVASMFAAPAFAATTIIKKTEKAPVTKSVTVKPSVRNANARVVVVKKVRRSQAGRYHHRGPNKKVVVIKKKIIRR